MRPLGETQRRHGWTVRGLLLPGFGAEIARLAQFRADDWVAAVMREMAALRATHSGVLLAGYSLGGALAIQAAATAQPDALALIAPFWRFEAGWRGRLLPALTRLFPIFRPFQQADFADPGVQRMVRKFLPEADLADPEIQAAIRHVSVPTAALDELRRAGWAAYRAASAIQCRVLIVQGARDEIARPEWTRRLAGRFTAPVVYHEVPADHDLLSPGEPAWPAIEAVVLDFAARLRWPDSRGPVGPEGTGETDDGRL